MYRKVKRAKHNDVLPEGADHGPHGAAEPRISHLGAERDAVFAVELPAFLMVCHKRGLHAKKTMQLFSWCSRVFVTN